MIVWGSVGVEGRAESAGMELLDREGEARVQALKGWLELPTSLNAPREGESHGMARVDVLPGP